MITEPIVMVARIRASTPQKFHAVLTRTQQETRAGDIVRFKDAKAGEWKPTHRKTLVIASSGDSESDVADFIDRWGASMITGNTSKPIKETTVEKEEYTDCTPATGHQIYGVSAAQKKAAEAEPVMHKPTAVEIKAAEVQPTWLMVEPGYAPLFNTLKAALDQAQYGKGKERHANDRAFVDQPILTLTRLYGLGYPMGQAAKKSEEALRLPTVQAQAELLGAINYLAAAYLRIGELGDA